MAKRACRREFVCSPKSGCKRVNDKPFSITLAADLYVTLLEKVHADNDSVPHGRYGFFFGASGEHEFYDVCKAVAEALVDLGRGKSSEPTTYTKEEMDKYFGPAGVRLFPGTQYFAETRFFLILPSATRGIKFALRPH